MNEYKFSEIEIGFEESFVIAVDKSKMEKFLDISKDTNPLHNDTYFAKKMGFQDRVVYGLLTSSFYSTLVGVYLPGKYCILQGIDIQFSKPVYVGDVLKVSGKVSYINEAYKMIEIKAFIMNQDNIKVSKATIKAGVMHE